MAQDEVSGDDPAQSKKKRERPPVDKDPVVHEVDAYAVLSYLIGGVLLYGAIGWLVDRWLGTEGFVGLGIVLGAAGGIVTIWLRYSKR